MGEICLIKAPHDANYAPDTMILRVFLEQVPDDPIAEAYSTLYGTTYIKTRSGKTYAAIIYPVLDSGGREARVSFRRVSPSRYNKSRPKNVSWGYPRMREVNKNV